MGICNMCNILNLRCYYNGKPFTDAYSISATTPLSGTPPPLISERLKHQQEISACMKTPQSGPGAIDSDKPGNNAITSKIISLAHRIIPSYTRIA